MSKVYRDFFLFPDIFILSCLIAANMTVIILFGKGGWIAISFAIGLIAFSLSEYMTHRFLFHLKTPQNPFLLKMLKRLHYDHHSDPDDLHLLFLPLWYSIPNMIVWSALFYIISGNLFYTLAFMCGLKVMLFFYEWKHYVAHRPIKPRTKFGVWMKKIHILHHYKNENYWYGVSNPVGDYLFGTMKEEKTVETSKTARDLEKRTFDM
ncbi:sterol desaturase family protein [Pseudalkalibacillus berkeleyi]|uniref:Sterol desaturase family protein n=1 Tax=Pseudalkalibacillus berkeleyi TaxID=1069813 RepID=A0ABS9H2N0_9BACL|nr:sterol desaturase family protein [Pseudalkalibacillus berkeleyi]MCF6138361.1 sterol desaturase family protein [Pseudalkalibacillus berkeleyi]